MGYPLVVKDFSEIGSLFVVRDNREDQKNGTGLELSQPKVEKKKGVDTLSTSVNEAKENGRIQYMQRAKVAMQDVLEGKEFISSWAKGVSLACVVTGTGKKCFISDGQEAFPILTEKNAPLSKPMQLFVDQIQPDRYIPVRFGMSNTGNKKATRDKDFCQLVEGCFFDHTPQTYDGKEYYDGLTVGYDSQMNPLVYSSFDRKVHIVKDTVLGENLYGDLLLLDYSDPDGVVVLRHTAETNAVREKQARVVMSQSNNKTNEVNEAVMTQEVVTQKELPVQEPSEKNKIISSEADRQIHHAGRSKEKVYNEKKHPNTVEKMFNEEYPNLLKIATLQNKSQNIAEVLLTMHPKAKGTSSQYRLDSLTLSYLHQHTPLTQSTATPGTRVRSKNGVAGVIVENINPVTKRAFNKKTPGMVKVQYFRKDPSSGKERSIACMTKVENLYAIKPSKKSTPAAQPRDHKGTKG